MRIVVVNHCHPDMGHICAARARAFAEALTRRGHAVVLVSESLSGADGDTAEDLTQRLARHDWAAPLFAAARPRPAPLLTRAREGKLGVANKAVLAWNYLLRGEVFADWTSASRPLWPVIAGTFKPDVVWGSFGNTGVLRIAQGIATAAGAPWVADMKDPWSGFVPPPLRRLTAFRFRDARAFTALSAGHGAEVRRWFGRGATVVHSAVPAAWLRHDREEPSSDVIRLTLSGSLYADAHLKLFAAGVLRWLARRDDPRPVQIDYYGNEGDRLRAAFAGVANACRFSIKGRVPVDELFAAQTGAHANAFIANPAVLFHHKILELAATGRPVVVVPGVSAEERGILARLGVRLHAGADTDTIARALHMTEAGASPASASDALTAYTWDAQAEILESVLRSVAP